jgi:hypothetical protein
MDLLRVAIALGHFPSRELRCRRRRNWRQYSIKRRSIAAWPEASEPELADLQEPGPSVPQILQGRKRR